MKDPTLERTDTLEKLAEAVELLIGSLDVRLIPVNGVMFGYAIRGARDKNGVAAVTGGIITKNDKPHRAGSVDFGVDEDIARIILTVMKFDPRIRSAAVLQYTRNLHKRMESLLFECALINAGPGSPGINTMDWSVASCCREGVPDVCFPYAGRGNESLVLLFGEDPIDVTNNIIMISNRIIGIEL